MTQSAVGSAQMGEKPTETDSLTAACDSFASPAPDNGTQTSSTARSVAEDRSRAPMPRKDDSESESYSAIRSSADGQRTSRMDAAAGTLN